ncbi:MAG: protein kinase [Candidatus Krumholzibacteria bacterium]
MIGQTISHYKILSKLGEGGMGVVYKASDTKLKRTVALKFLSPHLLANDKDKQRFLHEAQAAAGLNHPNICTVHEIHEADGHTFMVMEHIEGTSLRDKIESGPMAIDDALETALQVAKGLSKAHGQGIVHRDIKPGNVLLTEDGDAKIVDFGLAKLATQTRLTKTGATVGTVMYMSPEQAKGEGVDHRTDVWSLGVVLYEMLAGRLPFRGDIEQAVVYSIMNQDPDPVTSTRKDVPIALEDIIEKALSKDPEKRYESVDAFLAALEEQRDHRVLGITERRFTFVRKLRRRKRLTAGVAAVVVVALAAVLIQTLHTRSMEIDSVAVLPFVNLSGDEGQEYFSDGMTEALINELGQIGALTVISRTSVMQFKGTDKPLPEIARELNVDAIIEASVTRDGEKVRITAQLIRANPERQMWAESYTRDAGDLLSLHAEVAQAIAERIEVAVTAREQERLTHVRTVDPQAYDAYLKGRYYSYVWAEEEMKKGLRYYVEAIEIDPTYAQAYAGLADCYSTLGLFGFMPGDEAMPKARAAAKKAVELEPSLGIAHAMLGWVKFAGDCDWYGPDADFRRAVELSPNNADVHTWYDQYLTTTGRFDEAIVHSKRAVELDPLTPTTALHLAWVYEYAGRYDDAIEVTKMAIEMKPSDPYGQLQLAGGYLGKGMRAEAVAAVDSALALSTDPNDQVMLVWAGYGYGLFGRTDEAEEILDKLVAPIRKAMVCKGLGRTDEMFEWLEKAYENPSGCMMDLVIDFGEHRDDPRYIDLCRRIGIPLDE